MLGARQFLSKRSTPYCFLLASLLVLLWGTQISADHCPEDRPYHRGSACDSCDWREVLEQYKAGELSTTRESRIFDHEIRVSVYCDVDRPVDVDDVYEKIDETEVVFRDLFGAGIDPADGIRSPKTDLSDSQPHILEVVVGICDYRRSYFPGVDDCVMYTLYTEDWDRRGDAANGIAFRNTPNEATHTTFVPFFPEGQSWWVPENRYANLQHEFTHLLDYTYFRVDGQRGPDIDWWVEGLPQYVQWAQFNDRASWRRGNSNATMLEGFTHNENTSNYYDGMRIFAFLNEYAPWLVQRFGQQMRAGVYSTPDRHLDWHNMIGYSAWLFQDEFEDWTSRRGMEFEGIAESRVQIPGFVDGDSD